VLKVKEVGGSPQFEERFGEFLRIAMQIQDKDKATSHGE
jgi:hypothetical protein